MPRERGGRIGISARDRALPLPASRLLAHSQAAAYCSMPRTTFDRICNVRPIIFPGETVKRFDRRDLDAWIEGLKGILSDQESDDDILARLG